VLVATAVIRFTNLGHIPLSPNEAGEALSVWQAWQPGAMTAVSHSPAYFSFTSLASQLLGYSDAVMRFIPALFGIGLVALPWFLRQRLGNIGALVMSIFLAVSPLQVILARTVGGDSIALFALLLTAVATIRWQDTDNPRWRRTLFIALGLGATTTTLFYSGLVTLALALWLQQRVGPQLVEERSEIEPLRFWRLEIGVGTAVFVVISTLFLWHLGGLGTAAQILADWVTQFRIQSDVATLLNPILLFGRYELLLFVLGTGLIAWAVWRNESTAVFAAFWFVALFLLILAQHGQQQNAVLLTLPGYFLLGHLANILWSQHRETASWGLALGLVVMGGLMWVNLARYGRIMTHTPNQLGNLWIAVMALTIGLASIYFVASYWDRIVALQAIIAGLLVLTFVYQWGTAWWLGHQAANDPRERWVTVPATDDDMRVLDKTLREVARQTANSDYDLRLFSLVDNPILRWYLRDYAHAQFGTAVPLATHYAAIIGPAEQPELAREVAYFGSDFAIAHSSVQANPGQSVIIDALRWWLFHESNTIVSEEDIILWIRSDLAGVSNQ
jgi:hypothetical protein